MTATGGRIRTGTFLIATVYGKRVFRGRLRLKDGKRGDRFDLPAHMNEKDARAHLARLQAQEDISHAVYNETVRRNRAEATPTGSGETCDEWHARYLPTKVCGEGHRRITGAVWSKYVSPIIGGLQIADLTRDDLEDVRDALDAELDAKKIRHTTARNAWSALTSAMKAACSSRDRSLRVHSAPLHLGILPPKKGSKRKRPWLYPREWSKLVASSDVPPEWRALYALMLYTGLRPNELRSLTWADIDIDAGTISISKAWDPEAKAAKAPKTDAGQRAIPIQPSLLPMLTKIRGKARELVAPMLSEKGAGEDRHASTLREHLALARVTRPRLTADNDTEEPLDFRSLRDSHATWLAISGVADKIIQRRLGHQHGDTTDRYIKAAESLDPSTIGVPFPPIPPEVWTKLWTRSGGSKGKTA